MINQVKRRDMTVLADYQKQLMKHPVLVEFK